MAGVTSIQAQTKSGLGIRPRRALLGETPEITQAGLGFGHVAYLDTQPARNAPARGADNGTEFVPDHLNAVTCPDAFNLVCQKQQVEV